MKVPLEMMRVLDLTWGLSGPFGTMILSDLGAEVIKVERLDGGDIARKNMPVVDGVSLYFFSINRGKKSIAIDLKGEKGREIFLRLVRLSDVVVENFVPGTMERLGLSYHVLKEYNPRLIYASCSGFGQTGPYRDRPAFDIIAQAMSGMMSITGEEGGPPVRVGVSIGDIAAGLFLAIAILSAYIESRESGEGQAIDISMLDCQVALLENAFLRYLRAQKVIG